MSSKLNVVCVDVKPKRRRSAITLEEKLRIIRMYEAGKIISSIAREVKRPISTVNTIVKDRTRIVESTKGAITLKDTIITKKRQGSILEMEKLLSNWIEDRTRNRKPLSSLIIQEKARSLHKDLQEKAGVTDAGGQFKASAGWFDRFKRRTNLQNFRIKEEPPDPEGNADGEFITDREGDLLVEYPTRPADGNEREEEPSSDAGKRFTAAGLAESFGLIDMALSKLKAMDGDAERFREVSRRIRSELSGYRAIYEEQRASAPPAPYVCARCRSELVRDGGHRAEDPQQPSTSGWTELTDGRPPRLCPPRPASPSPDHLSPQQTFVRVKSEDSH